MCYYSLFLALLAQNTDILQEVLSELMGRSLECRDPDDGMVYTIV